MTTGNGLSFYVWKVGHFDAEWWGLLEGGLEGRSFWRHCGGLWNGVDIYREEG